MNIVKRLTLRHMGVNKGRTVVTVCGIAVSVAMITAVFVSIASFLNMFVTLDTDIDGKYNAACYNITENQLESLKKDEQIDTLGVQYHPNEGETYFTKSGDYEDRIRLGDSGYQKMFITTEYDGELPKNENEIAVEQSFIKDNNLDWNIGKIVTFDILKLKGRPYEDNPDIPDEFIKIKTVSRKITAILHDNLPTQSAVILMYQTAPEEDENIDATFTLKNADFRSYDTIDRISKDNGVHCEANTASLRAVAYNPEDVTANAMLMITLVLIGIIMIASFMLIYNSFTMSLSERVKYLGMLASVGATKRQKRLSVYFEGFILGVIGIPLGIGAGILGISITLSIVGRKVISGGIITYSFPDFQQIKTVVPWWCIIAIIIFSIITIFISLLVPSLKASRITPIDAIRKNTELKIKPRKLKTPKLVRKMFGFEGELAHKNIKRQGKRTRLITFSIAMSVVLFLTVNYYCQSMLNFADLQYNNSFQILVDSSKKSQTESILNSIKNIEYHELDAKYVVYLENWDKNGTVEGDMSIDIDEKSINEDYLEPLKKNFNIVLVGLNDSEFNAMCETNGIDYNKYYGKDNNCVLLNDVSSGNNKAKPFNESMLGKTVKFSDFTEEEDGSQGDEIKHELKITDFADYDDDKYYFRYMPSGAVALYVPESVYFEKYCVADTYWKYQYMIEADNYKEAGEAINEAIESQNLDEYMQCYNYAEQYQAVETSVFVIEVFVYGFIALITLITVANIINTISTGIMLRKREFAMLKSVGITPKGFRKSICLETLLIGIKALIFSLPISVVLSYLMFKSMGEQILVFEPDWWLYLEVVLAVFIIIGLTMAYSVFKLRNDSIVDTLKNDLD